NESPASPVERPHLLARAGSQHRSGFAGFSRTRRTSRTDSFRKYWGSSVSSRSQRNRGQLSRGSLVALDANAWGGEGWTPHARVSERIEDLGMALRAGPDEDVSSVPSAAHANDFGSEPLEAALELDGEPAGLGIAPELRASTAAHAAED